MDQHIQIAAWAGVATLLLSVITIFLPLGWLSALGILANIVMQYGFYRIATREKLLFLKVMSIMVIAATIAFLLFSLIVSPKKIPSPEEIDRTIFFVVVALTFLFGVLSLLFGIALLPLRKKFGALLSWTAGCNIATGIAFILVVAVPVGVATFIIGIILEIALLFRATQKYR